jgi:GTP cyclohydrolase I
MAIEELVRLAEEEASCEVFGLLKRPDEKWVTERAYDNPKFVEDLVRDIALRLMSEPRIANGRSLPRISSPFTTIRPMQSCSAVNP